MHLLNYNNKVWEEIPVKPINTLQLFITNKCNLRCRACFYAHCLGTKNLSFNKYKKIVLRYKDFVGKINILGGEPTLHEDLIKMILFNQEIGLKTTIYTNGVNINKLDNINLNNVNVRVGVHGAHTSKKPLINVKRTSVPIIIVYMLRHDNINELNQAALMAEEFNCKEFYISSIRDIAGTGNYWKDNENTIPLNEYVRIVQEFINNYSGKLKKIHISCRGVIKSMNNELINHCRFGNTFPNNKKINCPLDISLNKFTNKLFNNRICNKNNECLLKKIVLKKT
jgi:MoaA/NifB/PqqE/SkfB family radical SAM enzyme